MARRIRGLRRVAEQQRQKRTIYIFAEGQNTEPAYFKAMRRHLRALITQPDIQITAPAGVPMTIAELAIQKKKSLKRNARGASGQLADEVWAVFDQDDHPQVPQAIALCQNAGVGIAYSNPCFELWLILHHQDFGKMDDRHKVQKHFATLCQNYDPDNGKQPDCAALMHLIEAAEARAAWQIEQRVVEGDQYGRPVTTVFRLTQAIRLAAQRKP